MKNIILTLTFSIFLFSSKGQEAEQRAYKHYVGAAAGFTTGYGLAYRYNPGRFNVQAAFAPYKDESRVVISTGLTFIYHLLKEEHFNFYLYQGNHFRYFEDKWRRYYYYGPYPLPYSNISRQMNNGLGMGFEFHFNRLSFNLMTGYGSFNNGRRLSMTVESGIFFRL
jgi:hypothetical protein